MREFRPASLALVFLCLTSCQDEPTVVPGNSAGPAQVDIDMSPSIQSDVSRPLWPFAVKWKLPKNQIMDKEKTKLDFTQSYFVGSKDFGYFRYTERVLTSTTDAGIELGDPIGAQIALLMSEHPGAEPFPIKKLPERVQGQGAVMTSTDWSSMSHVYHIHLRDPAPSSKSENADMITGYLLTFDMAGPPDHPWGSKGLFTRAVLTTLTFGAL